MATCFISAGQSDYFPHVKLCYGSLVCHQHSISDILFHAKTTLFRLTGQTAELTINRADICTDWAMPVTDLQVLTSDYFLFTGRCDFSPHFVGPVYTGWHVGNAEVMFRCYDKLLEVQRDKERRLFYEAVYAGHEAVTRLELQLRGGYVRRFGLTVHNLEQLFRGVYAAMCTVWLCLYDQPIARDGNQSKRRQASHLHPIWRLQQQVADPVPLRKKKEFEVQDEEQKISNRRRYHLQRAIAATYSGILVPPPLEIVAEQIEADLFAAYQSVYRRVHDSYAAALQKLDDEYSRCKLESAPDPARLLQAATVKMLPF